MPVSREERKGSAFSRVNICAGEREARKWGTPQRFPRIESIPPIKWLPLGRNDFPACSFSATNLIFTSRMHAPEFGKFFPFLKCTELLCAYRILCSFVFSLNFSFLFVGNGVNNRYVEGRYKGLFNIALLLSTTGWSMPFYRNGRKRVFTSVVFVLSLPLDGYELRACLQPKCPMIDFLLLHDPFSVAQLCCESTTGVHLSYERHFPSFFFSWHPLSEQHLA